MEVEAGHAIGLLEDDTILPGDQDGTVESLLVDVLLHKGFDSGGIECDGLPGAGDNAEDNGGNEGAGNLASSGCVSYFECARQGR